MKRLSVIGLLLGALSAALFGCPVYDDSTPYCTPGDTTCPGFGGGSPIEGGCTAPLQCGPEAICGSDQTCHPGDCSEWGCPKGYACGSDLHTDFPVCEPAGQVTVTTGTSMGAGMKTTSATGGGSPGAGGAGGGAAGGGAAGGGNAGGGGAGGTSAGGAPGTGGAAAGGAPGTGGGGAPGTGGAPH